MYHNRGWFSNSGATLKTAEAVKYCQNLSKTWKKYPDGMIVFQRWWERVMEERAYHRQTPGVYYGPGRNGFPGGFR